MTTLAEIESAASALPRKQQQRLIERLAAKLAIRQPAAGPSAHDLMKDGCGLVSTGKRDLSTNKKHLRGYGR